MRIITAILLGCLCLGPMFAAGRVTQGQTPMQLGTSDIWVLQFDWTGDASDGSVPSITAQSLAAISGYQPTGVQFIPASPSPTTGYSVAIYAAVIGSTRLGADILAGAGASLSATVASYGAIPTTATPLLGTITMQVTGNSIASAKGTVQIFFQKPGLFGRKGGNAAGDVTAAANLPSGECITGAGLKGIQAPSANCTVDSNGNMGVESLSTGPSPPTCTPGTAGLLCLKAGTAPTGASGIGEIYTKTGAALQVKLGNDTEDTLCTVSVGCGGGSTPLAPRGFVPFGGIGSATVTITVSTTASHPLCVPLNADQGGWALSNVVVLASSSGADHLSAAAYDISGNLLTNGSGSTVALAGAASYNTITFTSLTVPAGPFQLCFSSPNDVGSAVLYGSTSLEAFSAGAVNVGKSSSTYSLFRALNTTSGTTTITWPGTLSTRTPATSSDNWWVFNALN